MPYCFETLRKIAPPSRRKFTAPRITVRRKRKPSSAGLDEGGFAKMKSIDPARAARNRRSSCSKRLVRIRVKKTGLVCKAAAFGVRICDLDVEFHDLQADHLERGLVTPLATPADIWYFGQWGDDGFLYAQDRSGGISRIPAQGGAVEPIVEVIPARTPCRK